MADTFWNDLSIPYQEEDEEFNFANLVIVAQHFLKAVGRAAQLGEQAEVLTEQIATVTVQRDRKDRELKVLRRKILASNYKGMSKSASRDVQEAFILAMAEKDGLLPELEALEAEIERLTREIEAREPRVAEFRNRMKLIETTMGWGKQYLDFEKLVIRSTSYGN